MRITATAPCRVDLAGGTLDIWPLYLFHQNALTVNFAVDRYATAVLETRDGPEIMLSSADQSCEEHYASIHELAAAKEYRLPLLAWVARHFAPPTGFHLATDSQAPAGAGISGSSALIIAIASAFNQLTGAGLGLESIREVSQNIEAQIIRVPTGSQDYYPALYGGVSALEFSPSGIRRQAIRISPRELNERFLLAYTGLPRNSGVNNWEVMKAHIDGDPAVSRNFERIAEIANGMRRALEAADWDGVARLLREEWSFRRANAPGISTPLIDRLMEAAARAGASAAKVCGAGGGGCVLFLMDPDRRQQVQAAIIGEGGSLIPSSLAPLGVQVQTAAL